jgi:pimeloyl-ACP methyl ester carboxylesterase
MMNRIPSAAKMDKLRNLVARNQRPIVFTALICIAAGVVLSHHLAPGVKVEEVMLAGDTPALKLTPASAGPHPVALLAHGYSGSKENLFWYGEALSAAGFVCFSPDLPGHGGSPRSYSFVEAAHAIGDFTRDIGPVDVLVGHSMGGGAVGEAVREGLVHPKLVIAVGSGPRLGENAPPLLLLVGRFDEFFKSEELKTRTDAQLIISPWSNHGLELFDPLLIHAAVNAACAAVGKAPPPAFTAWRWRVAGIALAVLGALGLVVALPKFPPRFEWARGIFVAALVGSVWFLTLSAYVDFKPHPQNFLPQITGTVITLLVLIGAGKLRAPRLIFAALAIAIAIGGIIVTDIMAAHLTIHLFQIVRFSLVFAPALFVGTIVGMFASFRGSRQSGDVAMALIVGCGLCQLGNTPRAIPESTKVHQFIKLDAKLCDACVGQYEFALDNVFRSPANVKIWRKGDQMFEQATGRRVLLGAHEIFPESETNFFLKFNGAELTFVKNGKGEVTKLIHHMDGLPDSEAKKFN